jgi:hypothetical protein
LHLKGKLVHAISYVGDNKVILGIFEEKELLVFDYGTNSEVSRILVPTGNN